MKLKRSKRIKMKEILKEKWFNCYNDFMKLKRSKRIKLKRKIKIMKE
jgi:hypothetical protein